MEKEMATIKEKLKSYTVSVDKMGRDKAELAHELDLARQRIQGKRAKLLVNFLVKIWLFGSK